MPKAKKSSRHEKGYRTNMASEFHVLSLLHRMGYDASLTLGNKKAVDIVVFRERSYPATIDVKGVADRMDWLLGNCSMDAIPNHFVVLVGYEETISDPRTLPRIWVFPHEVLLPMIRISSNEKTKYVSRKQVIAQGGAYEGAWQLLSRTDQ